MTHPSVQFTLDCVCGKSPCSVPFGLCHCGCGEQTEIVTSRQANTKYRWRVGMPKRYVHNHHTRLSPDAYLEQDRGYNTPCWIWQRSLDKKGYGRAMKDRAHILYFEKKNGSVPIGFMLDHLCRQRACVNPDHLEVVTNEVNVQRGTSAAVTAEQVLEIRRRLALGERQIDLARELGVTTTCINFIAKRKTWKNL